MLLLAVCCLCSYMLRRRLLTAMLGLLIMLLDLDDSNRVRCCWDSMLLFSSSSGALLGVLVLRRVTASGLVVLLRCFLLGLDCSNRTVALLSRLRSCAACGGVVPWFVTRAGPRISCRAI
uniref:(northern house mosquito) hypothetical protein n=1 Tax=Culex pipiens TaxID=7175 RepID=A0A8D8E7H2_CULPI